MDLKTIFRRGWTRFRSYGLNLIVLSILTGMFAGFIVACYTICAGYGEELSSAFYALLLENPAYIPLLFLALVAGAFVIGTLTKLVPMIRGSGIPQTEGAARGLLVFNWFTSMCSMFAASLACIFLGLPAGSEGPSVQIGGCAGDAVGIALRRSRMIRRLQISAGASAGFAVAFNAPITGMIFSLEEAFKSLSPQAFICSSISVITALFVRNAFRTAVNMSVGFFLDGFAFGGAETAADYAFVALGALIVALVAVVFYYGMFAVKKLFRKVTFFKGVGKFLFPFLFAGACGLISSYCIGGGLSFIDALSTGGTGAISVEGVFGLSTGASVAIVVALRFIALIIIMACGVPCGAFVPMLAVGAGLGALLSVGFQTVGMSAEFSDFFVIICMAAFFTAFVRAPITSICMTFELTGQFENFLPVLMGVTIGYIISEICRLQPGYEKLLNEFIETEGINAGVKKVTLTVKIQSGSQADGGKVRKIIWPANGLITSVIHADGRTEVPDGATILSAGENIIFVCETDDEKRLKEYLYEIVGEPSDTLDDK